MKESKGGQKEKKVLVTGGAGFIGSNVVRFLLLNSYKVTVLDNFSTGYKENLKFFPQVKVIRGDIRDNKILSNILDGVKIIFHLAASVGNVKSLEDPLFDSDVNVLGTLSLLEAARKKRVKKIIFSSSAALYGEPQQLPIAEGHPLEPDSPYGVSKLAAEKHCLCFSRTYELDVICLRYFNVYGENQRYDAYGNVIPIFAAQLLKNEPLKIYGDGGQTRDFVNVEDVARANLLAAQICNVSGVFNIGSGVSLAGVYTKLNYAPPRKGEVKHSLANISRAKSILQYKPEVSIEEGLEKYLEWIKNSNS